MTDDEQLHSLVEHLPFAVYRRQAGPESIWSYVSPTIETLLGYPRAQWLGNPQMWPELLHPDDRELVLEEQAAAVAECRAFLAEYRLRHASGDWKWVRDRAAIIVTGDRTCLEGGLVDISLERSHRSQLEKARDLFARLLRHSVDVVKVLDHERRVRLISPQIEELTGFPPEAFVGQPCEAMAHPDDRPAVVTALERCITHIEDPATVQARLQRFDGTWVWVELRARNLLDEPAVRGVVVAERDISTRRRAAAEVDASNLRKSAILDASIDAIVSMDALGKVVDWNRAAEELFGYSAEEAKGKAVADLIIPESLQGQHWRGLAHYLETGEGPLLGQRVQLDAVHAAGEELPIELGLSVAELSAETLFVAAIRDLSEARKHEAETAQLEARLRQAQRLEAIGRLAGGIAHDFNNLLSVIQNYAAFLVEALTDDDPRRDDAQEIVSASQRAAELTRQLLLFARQENARVERVDVAEAVRSLASLLKRTLTEDVDLEVSIDPAVPPIEIDRSQFDQVLLNLVTNARDALPSTGKISAEATTKSISPDHPLTDELDPGDYVVITIRDDGPGIPAAIRDRVFEPFFTTKDRGEGTGLGLATVYGIVKRFGGTVTLESEEGAGAAFAVHLPVSTSDAGPDEGEPARSAPGHRDTVAARILLVEDEEALLRVGVRVLEAAGYEVAGFSDPLQALEQALQMGPFDLLVTDVVMPGMTGRDLADRLGLPTLYVSGYTDSIVADRGLIGDDERVLQKPFRGEALTQAVAQVLQPRR